MKEQNNILYEVISRAISGGLLKMKKTHTSCFVNEYPYSNQQYWHLDTTKSLVAPYDHRNIVLVPQCLLLSSDDKQCNKCN